MFSFHDINKDDENIIAFAEMIKSRLVPSCVFGKDQSSTYEFYNPLVSARQLGFGQLPICLYFSNLIKPQEVVPNGTHYQSLLDMIPYSSTVNLDSWKFATFTSPLFNIWWEQWCDHLFCVSPKPYCEKLDPAYND
jgi:hypothetical protein